MNVTQLSDNEPLTNGRRMNFYNSKDKRIQEAADRDAEAVDLEAVALEAVDFQTLISRLSMEI